jgi:aspartate aminotransferase
MQDILLNPNISNLKESSTLKINMKVKQMRSQGKDVVHFGFGQSPFPVCSKIVERLQEHAGDKDYLPTLGLPKLREEIVSHYKKHFDYDFEPDYICIGPGSKELIYQALMILEGTVLVPAPSWVSYGPQVNSRGKHISRILTKKENNYKLQADELESVCKTLTADQKILIINSPNNPTGAVYNEDEIKQIVKVAKENNIVIISDEIYALIDFTGEKKTGFFHYYPEGTIVTAGLSKSHSAGGYRLGFLATSQRLSPVIKALKALVSETFSAVSAPIQHAAVAAYENSREVEQYVDKCTSIHKEVANYISSSLEKSAIGCSKPQGAFYLLIDFEKDKELINKKLKIQTSTELANYLLDKYQVALLPGDDFYLPKEQLAFRLATVDYDGEKALNNPIDFEDKQGVYRHIIQGVRQLEKFVTDLRK